MRAVCIAVVISLVLAGSGWAFAGQVTGHGEIEFIEAGVSPKHSNLAPALRVVSIDEIDPAPKKSDPLSTVWRQRKPFPPGFFVACIVALLGGGLTTILISWWSDRREMNRGIQTHHKRQGQGPGPAFQLDQMDH